MALVNSATQDAADLEAVQVRQHQVEQHQVRTQYPRLLEAVVPVMCRVDGEAGIFEIEMQSVSGLLFVFDDQDDGGSHGVSRSEPAGCRDRISFRRPPQT